MKKFITFIFVAVFSALIPLGSLAQAYPLRPSGQFVFDENNAYYFVYYTPGTNYSDKRLKYIGSQDVLRYYMNRGRWPQQITNAERGSYTIHDHNLGLPCGEAVRDFGGRIAFMEPLGWPVGQQDQNDSVYSSSENFPYYVQYVDWLAPYSGLHHQNILAQKGFNQVGNYSNITDMLIYPYGIPNCTIVKQTGSGDFYRVSRHRTPYGVEVERKAKIQNTEMLNLWLSYNSYYYEADITSLPSVGNVTLPPSLLVRTLSDPMLYFVDDEGRYIKIATQETYKDLSLQYYPVTYLASNLIDAAKIIDPYSF